MVDAELKLALDRLEETVKAMGGSLELLSASENTAKIRYTAAQDKECPQCAAISPLEIKQWLIESLKADAPQFTNVIVVFE